MTTMSTAGIVGVSLVFVASLAVTGVLFYKLGQANNSGNNKLTPTESNTALTVQGSQQNTETNSLNSGKLNTNLTMNDEDSQFCRELGQRIFKIFDVRGNNAFRRQRIIEGTISTFLRLEDLTSNIVPGIYKDNTGKYSHTNNSNKWNCTIEDLYKTEFEHMHNFNDSIFSEISIVELMKARKDAEEKNKLKVPSYRHILSVLYYFVSNSFDLIKESDPQTFDSKVEELGKSVLKATEYGLFDDIKTSINKINDMSLEDFCKRFCVPNDMFASNSFEYDKYFINDYVMPRLTEMFDLIKSKKSASSIKIFSTQK